MHAQLNPISHARIHVVGVGGGGNNAINRMMAVGLNGVDFVALNSDSQALKLSDAPQKLQIGRESTRGLGAGGRSSVGENAAVESEAAIARALEGSDLVFVTAGMGGGTGSGAAPVVARIAKSLGALTIGVVTLPFTFEGKYRMETAEAALEKLRAYADTVIVIPNERLLEFTDQTVTIADSFSLADDILRQGIQSISELITLPGLINLDFADLRAILCDSGTALMGLGIARGENRARIAAEQAIHSRLLDRTIAGARGIIINVTGNSSIGLHEIYEAASLVRETAHPDANIIFGALVDDDMADQLAITLIATEFESTQSAIQPMSMPLPMPTPILESPEVPVVAAFADHVEPLPAAPKRAKDRDKDPLRLRLGFQEISIPSWAYK